VSVCPVEALSLAETRLEASEACIECGDCVPACPMGALSLAPAGQFRHSPPKRRQYDLVVVGAGPGGSSGRWGRAVCAAPRKAPGDRLTRALR
jgi:Fe-S-cluster-containing dehydrogenase component